MKQLIFLIAVMHSLFIFSQRNTKTTTTSFDLNEVAMLDIEPSNTAVLLRIDSPLNSGAKANITASNNEKWINFSSAISSSSQTRNISIKIENGNVPSGTNLILTTSNYVGTGKGQLGYSYSTTILNKTSQVIISNIGGAFTGNGISNGYKLNYSLEISDYKLLDMDSSDTLTISLTLTDSL